MANSSNLASDRHCVIPIALCPIWLSAFLYASTTLVCRIFLQLWSGSQREAKGSALSAFPHIQKQLGLRDVDEPHGPGFGSKLWNCQVTSTPSAGRLCVPRIGPSRRSTRPRRPSPFSDRELAAAKSKEPPSPNMLTSIGHNVAPTADTRPLPFHAFVQTRARTGTSAQTASPVSCLPGYRKCQTRAFRTTGLSTESSGG